MGEALATGPHHWQRSHDLIPNSYASQDLCAIIDSSDHFLSLPLENPMGPLQLVHMAGIAAVGHTFCSLLFRSADHNGLRSVLHHCSSGVASAAGTAALAKPYTACDEYCWHGGGFNLRQGRQHTQQAQHQHGASLQPALLAACTGRQTYEQQCS